MDRKLNMGSLNPLHPDHSVWVQYMPYDILSYTWWKVQENEGAMVGLHPLKYYLKKILELIASCLLSVCMCWWGENI